MNTTENNKLIAEFMGMKSLKECEHQYSDGKNIHFSVTGMNYHSSWEWLMPVVEKIEYMLHDDIVITIEYKTCVIPVVAGTFNTDNDGFDIVINGDTKFDACYKAVVEFINWHNEYGSNYDPMAENHFQEEKDEVDDTQECQKCHEQTPYIEAFPFCTHCLTHL